jgi:hypothetical protein
MNSLIFWGQMTVEIVPASLSFSGAADLEEIFFYNLTLKTHLKMVFPIVPPPSP